MDGSDTLVDICRRELAYSHTSHPPRLTPLILSVPYVNPATCAHCSRLAATTVASPRLSSKRMAEARRMRKER